MSNQDSHNAADSNEPLEEVFHDSNINIDDENYNTVSTPFAINTVYVNNEDFCKGCSTNVKSNEVMQCYMCDVRVHAVNCSQDLKLFSATFMNNLASVNGRKNCLFFICNLCQTKKEKQTAMSVTERIDKFDRNLSTIMESMKEMKLQINECKENAINKPPTVNIPNTETEPATNVSSYADKLKTTIVIKNNSEAPVTAGHIESLVVESRSQVDRLLTLQNGDQLVTLSSEEERDKLKNTLIISGVKNIENIQSKLPTITITGIKLFGVEQPTADDVYKYICAANETIKDEIDKGELFKVLFIKKSKVGNSYFAVARVSNNIRYVIRSKNNDNLRIGVKICKVYDRYYVKRCNRCQCFGHYMETKNPDGDIIKTCTNTRVCGHCSSVDHFSDKCPVKNNPEKHSCINCKNKGRDNINHSAISSLCPCYEDMRKRERNSIPLYSSKNWLSLTV